MKKYLLIRMMQTVAIILFAANVSAQNQNVVISVRNIPVRTALTQIRQAANVDPIAVLRSIYSGLMLIFISSRCVFPLCAAPVLN